MKFSGLLILITIINIYSINTCKAGCSICDQSQNLCFSCNSNQLNIIEDGTCASITNTKKYCKIYNNHEDCIQCKSESKLINRKCFQKTNLCEKKDINDKCKLCPIDTLFNQGKCYKNSDQQPQKIQQMNHKKIIQNNQYSKKQIRILQDEGGFFEDFSGIMNSPENNAEYNNIPTVEKDIITTNPPAAQNNTEATTNPPATENNTSTTNPPATQNNTATTNPPATQNNTSTTNPPATQNNTPTNTDPFAQNNTTNNPTSTIHLPNDDNNSLPSNSPNLDNNTSTPSTNNSVTTNPPSPPSNNSSSFPFITTNPNLCIKYNGPLCIQCNSNASILLNTYQNCILKPPNLDSNCNLIDVNNNCVSCLTNYNLNGTDCVSSIIDCISFNANGSCSKCRTGILTSDKYCQDTNCAISQMGVCNQCKTFYYTLNNYSCVLIPIPYCIQYTGTECNYCINGYILQNSVCKISNNICLTYDNTNNLCTLCSPQYKLNNYSICVDINCNSSSNASCLTCNYQYYLNNGTCNLIPIPNCDIFDSNICKNCSNRYYLFDNVTCLSVDTNCDAYNSTTGNCITCKTNKLLVGIYCLDINCLLNQLGICTKCKRNYYLDGNQNCLIIPVSNCIMFQNNACYICELGYFLSLGQCNKRSLTLDSPNNLSNLTTNFGFSSVHLSTITINDSQFGPNSEEKQKILLILFLSILMMVW